MPAKVESGRDIGASKKARRARIRLVLILCALGGMFSATAIRAEENGMLTGTGPSLTTLSVNLALVSNHSLFGKERLIQLPFDARFSATLKELAAEKEKGGTLPKPVLRQPLVWFKEVPRTKFLPGFGPFFQGETVEPLRCNGAGVEDSRYLFVKLSFRF